MGDTVAMNLYSPKHYLNIFALWIFLVPLDDQTMLETKLKGLRKNQTLCIQIGTQAQDSVIARYDSQPIMVMLISLCREIFAL